MRRGVKIAAVVGGLMLVGAVAAAPGPSEQDDPAGKAVGRVEAPDSTTTTLSVPETTTTTVLPPPPEPVLTPEQVELENAVMTAESYLEIMSFSRQGLIDQLEFEGFSGATAEAAIPADVDWMAEAVESAQTYQEIMPMSRQGLVDQLRFDGFTPAEAEHGVASVFGQ